MTKVYIENYGCSANRSNAEIIAGLLERAGCVVVTDEKAAGSADIVILNTCIVKGPTENRAVRRIKEITRAGNHLIVSGCMAEAEPELIHELSEKAILVGPDHIREITKAVDVILGRRKPGHFIGRQHEIKLLLPKRRYNKVIGIIQISEGCDGNCAYCITRLAKGKLRSYSPEKIITEAKQSLRDGVREIWLTSQDCAAYGHGLPDLLHDISQLKGRFLVRLGMMNPNNVMRVLDELIEAFKEEKIFKFLHIPVQSGNDDVLKSMKRRYSADDFRRIISRFRDAMPDMTISTDIICGFPGETEEQFNDSVELVRKIKPDVLNISRFWPRPGTAAEKMEGQMHGNVTKERSKKLQKEFEKIALERNKAWTGWKGPVLIDEKGKPGTGTMVGRNYAYKPVVVRQKEHGGIRLGDLADVEIRDASVFDLRS